MDFTWVQKKRKILRREQYVKNDTRTIENCHQSRSKASRNFRNEFKVLPVHSTLVQILFPENRDIHTYVPMP
jgi:hypothetical protein